jgi:hypothetical protein
MRLHDALCFEIGFDASAGVESAPDASFALGSNPQ